ncbi:MAG: cytochrome P450 [Xanthomonadales bacterium]|nr:cytochrome P450 [Xanthomonadales bacterium]NNL96219.1 cytochrome P450 [Xanthomonadales bacterium]
MNSASATLEPFNPFSEALHSDPYAVYASYRSRDPVHRGLASAPGYPESWYIFTYEHVLEILKEERISNERQAISSGQMTPSQLLFYEALSHWLLFRDPPVHSRHRRLLSSAFSARNFAGWKTEIEEISTRRVQAMIGSTQADITHDCFRVVPLEVIAKILGLDILDIDTMLEFTDSFARALDFRTDPSVFDRAAKNIKALDALLIPQIESRRTQAREDLLSRLVEANQEAQFSDRELVYVVMLILTAGYETTINQMGNGFIALMHDRPQWELLCRNEVKMNNAVHELIRFDPALQVMSRSVLEDVKIGGKLIRAGDDLNLMFGSANRDPSMFEQPEKLDLARANANRNLTFGHGLHFCIGAQLARMETVAVLEALIEQCPRIRLDESRPVRWKNHISLRGPQSLPVVV